jgi:hypothetical protein
MSAAAAADDACSQCWDSCWYECDCNCHGDAVTAASITQQDGTTDASLAHNSSTSFEHSALQASTADNDATADSDSDVPYYSVDAGYNATLPKPKVSRVETPDCGVPGSIVERRAACALTCARSSTHSHAPVHEACSAWCSLQGCSFGKAPKLVVRPAVTAAAALVDVSTAFQHANKRVVGGVWGTAPRCSKVSRPQVAGADASAQETVAEEKETRPPTRVLGGVICPLPRRRRARRTDSEAFPGPGRYAVDVIGSIAARAGALASRASTRSEGGAATRANPAPPAVAAMRRRQRLESRRAPGEVPRVHRRLLHAGHTVVASLLQACTTPSPRIPS